MLSKELINEFERKLNDFWTQEILHNDNFISMLNRREAGHGLANYIETKTQEELVNISNNRYQLINEKNIRSMGDFWIKEGTCNFYTPVNIKTGIKIGSPNIVTIDKIITGIAKRKIDSYYLFIIKFIKINRRWQVNICKIVNLFNILDYVVFDLGPLQLMLNEHKLYSNINDIQHVEYDLKDILSKFCKLYSDGYPSFIANRNERKNKYEHMLNNFDVNKPIDQSKIKWKQ